MAVLTGIPIAALFAASLVSTMVGTGIYLLVMFTLGRHLLASIAERAKRGRLSPQGFLAAVMLTTLASAWVTERLGIHALFGAFLVGALLPATGAAAELLSSQSQAI